MKKFVKGLIGVGVVVILLGACGAIFSDTDDTETTKTEEVATEKTTEAETPAPAAEKETKEEVAPQKEEPKAEPLAPVDLGPGKFVVGEDIKEGRYVVSTQDNSGNFVVNGEFGFPEVNEILGTDQSFAVNNVTVSLEEGQEIDIAGLNSVHFEPKN